MPKRDLTFLRLALYLRHGLPLVTALELAAGEAESRATAKALAAMKTNVESGVSVADAMRGIPAWRAHADLAAAGEECGLLESAFSDIGHGPGPGALLLWFHRLLPHKLAGDALADAAAVLPPKERAGLASARSVKTLAEAAARFPDRFPAPAAAAFAAAPDDNDFRMRLLEDLAWATEQGLFRPATRSRTDGLLRAFAGLWLLIRSGVPLVDGLKILAPAVAHAALSRALADAAGKVAGGSTLTEPLRASGLFSPSMVEMVRLAEVCGALDDTCRKIAEAIAGGLF